MRPAEHLDFIAELLDEASRLVLAASHGRRATVKDGDPSQVVTATDRAAGQAIVSRIRAAFPGDTVIEEESGLVSRGGTRTWVVDPLDGTSNFAAGSPLFGIAVGLLVRGVPVAGGVALPRFGETYLAERGGGARLNGTLLPLESAVGLEASLVALGIDASTQEAARNDYDLACALALRCRGLRTSNSVFDLMMVARGAYGACLHRSTRIWDNVGPHVIVTEAGHVYTDLYGDQICYDPPDLRWADTFTMRAASVATSEAIDSIVQEWKARSQP